MFREDIITKNNNDAMYQWRYFFTLTVNAVNDAPDVLQPLEELEILDNSWAAAVVCYIVFYNVSHLIYSNSLCSIMILP